MFRPVRGQILNSSNQVPSFETPYVREEGYATRYRDARFQSGSGRGTHARETRAIRALLERALAHAPDCAGGNWLDMPSGAGRLSSLLPAARVVRVDRDAAMLDACGAVQGTGRTCARAAALPFADGSFRGALTMRLLHHIGTPDERRGILRELRRVTAGPLVVSFFESRNLQNLRRQMGRRAFGRRNTGRSAIRWATFCDDLRAAGWQPQARRPLCRWISEQWLVLATPSP